MTKAETGTHEFIGKAKTTAIYPLVIASKYNIPFLLDKQGVGNVSFAQNFIEN